MWNLETKLLHFEGPSFTFNSIECNYAEAFPAFLQSLDPREKAAIRSISWPMRHVRELYGGHQSYKCLKLPYQSFFIDICRLPNLCRLMLRYVPSDVYAVNLTGPDFAVLRRLLEDADEGQRWRVGQQFRRELVIREMRKQLWNREDVVIECVSVAF